MKCQMRVNDVFGCVFERRDAVCHQCATRKKHGDLLDAQALGCHLLEGGKFLCGADHSLGENTSNLTGFETSDVVHRLGVMSQ